MPGAVQPATPTSVPFGAIATTGEDPADADVKTISIILWNSNGTQNCTADCDASVTVDVGRSGDAVAIRVYRLDETHGNPHGVFMAQRDGAPMKKPYPTRAEFEAIRAASELPSCDLSPAAAPAAAGACDGVSATGSAVSLPLPQPSAALVHVCVAPAGGAPKPLWPSAGAGLTLRATTTPGEVFVRWSDVPSKCVGTYELFYSAGGEETWSAVDNVIPSDTLVTAFVHQQAGAEAAGCYSVRWVNAWGGKSALSPEVCVAAGEGGPLPFANA